MSKDAKEVVDPFAKPLNNDKMANATRTPVTNESDLSKLADDFTKPSETSKFATAAQQVQPPKATTLSVESKTEDEIDLDDLNETTLLKYNIAAKSLEGAAIMDIKPSHNDIVLRYCYYTGNNDDQVTRTNMARYKAWKYEFATIEDIKDGEQGLGDCYIDSTGKIRYADVVVMKINKIRLMSHYKAGLLRSLNRVDMANLEATQMAETTFKTEPGYNVTRNRHPKADIEFYNPMAVRQR